MVALSLKVLKARLDGPWALYLVSGGLAYSRGLEMGGL